MPYKDPEKQREYMRKAQAKYRLRHANDPAFAAKRRAYSKMRYHRTRAEGWEPSDAAKKTWRAWYLANRDAIPRRNREKYAQDPSTQRAYTNAWRKANPEKSRMADARRRAIHARADGHFTEREWLARIEEFDHRCGFCLERKPLTVEHMCELSRNGSNDIGNIIPACKACNTRKLNRGMLYMATRIAA